MYDKAHAQQQQQQRGVTQTLHRTTMPPPFKVRSFLKGVE